MSKRNQGRRLPSVRFDGTAHWFSIEHAASLVGTTTRKLDARARAGEFTFESDEDGNPCWFPQADITALHIAKLKVERLKAKRPPRPKTPAQLEAEWARTAEANANGRRDGPFYEHHLRMTLPAPSPVKEEPRDPD